MKVSVIVTTYNWPEALDLILMALCQQQQLPDEVLIADDGSGDATREVVKAHLLKAPFKLQHIWQEDLGFRAAQIRNLAIKAAESDYIIFIDGDCIPSVDFIAKHRMLAEKGYFIAGNRILLNEDYTKKVLAARLSLAGYKFRDWLTCYCRGNINRLLPALKLPFMFFNSWRKINSSNWQGVKTCNLAVWRDDLLTVDGFDASFTGWGYEDSDLVIRLLRYGVRRKLGNFAAVVIHLWHKLASRTNEQKNKNSLKAILASSRIRANLGLSFCYDKNHTGTTS